ncbi:MAG: hypothetical protein ACE5KE_13705 [Methanosarcinales archaeon]
MDEVMDVFVVKEDSVIIPRKVYENLLEELESLRETLEIMTDKELMSDIKESLEQFEKGEYEVIKSKEELDKLFE